MHHCAKNVIIKLTITVAPIKLYTKISAACKLRNNLIQLDLVNRNPQDRNGTIKYKEHFTLL